MNRHAIIADGQVLNVILWDGVATWSPPPGTALVALQPDERCEIGDEYDANASPRFTMPE